MFKNRITNNLERKINLILNGKVVRLNKNNNIPKVLMGVLGCCPAYDRYFKDGLSKEHIGIKRFNAKSILELVNFYEANYSELEDTRTKMNVEGLPYPQMKKLDMDSVYSNEEYGSRLFINYQVYINSEAKEKEKNMNFDDYCFQEYNYYYINLANNLEREVKK